MDSKTAKAIDRTLVKFEKELDRLKLLLIDMRADIQKHYGKKPA